MFMIQFFHLLSTILGHSKIEYTLEIIHTMENTTDIIPSEDTVDLMIRMLEWAIEANKGQGGQ
jgi:hypothetical protein